jgi:Leucine-rich repeat (LRR) protein
VAESKIEGLYEYANEGRTAMSRQSLLVAIVLAILSPAAMANSSLSPQRSASAEFDGGTGLPERVLHFPADRSLGRLKVRPAREERPVEGFHYWLRDSDWEMLGLARGAVTVPAGCQVRLDVEARQGWRDLSSLVHLDPDDLYMLSFQGAYASGAQAGDSCMAYVAHLTGLRALYLRNTSITAAGMRHIVALKNLRYLSTPDGSLDDAGMAYVGQLSTLTGLYLMQNRVTNAGLQHLAKLHCLAELELGGGQIDDDGLACLAELPRLRYLILWGKGFTDAGLARLKDVKALEILNLGVLEQITDAGLAQLANVPQLRDISLYHNTKITNAGLGPLKKLPSLRTLDIAQSQVADEGLAHLKEIKTLEGLTLPSPRITDRGLQYLSELPRLRALQLRRPSWGKAALDMDRYTDEGLRVLALCTEMQDLEIDRLGVTDKGVTHLARLTRLRKLSLSGISDESLRTLAQLHSLESLSISSGRLSISGLKSLNSLTNLRTLSLNGVVQDNAGLDLSGLAHLEDLTLDLQRRRVGTTVVTEPFREQDIAALGKLTRLKRLQISHGGATDASLRYLTSLSRLERLSLGGGGLTDDGLAPLASLSRLTSITLSGRFTDKALQHLQKLPELGFLSFLSGAKFSEAAVNEFWRDAPALTSLRGYETDRGPATRPAAGGPRR